MLVWSLRDDELGAAFADVWCAIPKIVFSRTLESVQGSAWLAEASVADEVATALARTQFRYSDYGAHLLSPILVQATGEPVLTYVRAKLFEPLGTSTTPRTSPGSTRRTCPSTAAPTLPGP